MVALALPVRHVSVCDRIHPSHSRRCDADASQAPLLDQRVEDKRCGSQMPCKMPWFRFVSRTQTASEHVVSICDRRTGRAGPRSRSPTRCGSGTTRIVPNKSRGSGGRVSDWFCLSLLPFIRRASGMVRNFTKCQRQKPYPRISASTRLSSGS